jgi:hypothetical protein
MADDEVLTEVQDRQARSKLESNFTRTRTYTIICSVAHFCLCSQRSACSGRIGYRSTEAACSRVRRHYCFMRTSL